MSEDNDGDFRLLIRSKWTGVIASRWSWRRRSLIDDEIKEKTKTKVVARGLPKDGGAR